MTHDTLSIRLRAHTRLTLWLLVSAAVVMVLTTAAGLRLWDDLMAPGPGEADGPAQREARARSLWWVHATMAGVGVLLLLLVGWGQRRTARMLGLVCPSCGGSLVVRRRSTRAALDAGMCVSCGARVVEDATAASAPSAPNPSLHPTAAR
jgi:hypothetical protein